MNRRAFLKGFAAAAGLAALRVTPANPAAPIAADITWRLRRGRYEIVSNARRWRVVGMLQLPHNRVVFASDIMTAENELPTLEDLERTQQYLLEQVGRARATV